MPTRRRHCSARGCSPPPRRSSATSQPPSTSRSATAGARPGAFPPQSPDRSAASPHDDLHEARPAVAADAEEAPWDRVEPMRVSEVRQRERIDLGEVMAWLVLGDGDRVGAVPGDPMDGDADIAVTPDTDL